MTRLGLASLLVLAGCAGAPPPPLPRPSATAPAAGPPPCPETLAPGGDPIEAESFQGTRIGRVCFIGGSDDAQRAAEKVVRLAPGDEIDAGRMKMDLEAILRLGIFEDAAVYGLKGNGTTLLFVVKERPRIGEVVVEGAKLLNVAAPSKKFSVAKQATYDPVRVHELAEAMRDECRWRGYASCEVRQSTEPLGAGLVRLKMSVIEGPLWHYAKVIFKGSSKISDADLRKSAALEPGKPFVQDEVDRAALGVTALYYERGMVEMHVDVSHGPPQKDGGLDVVFTLEEGDVFKFGTLRATKLGAPVEKELLSRVKLRPKQIVAHSVLAQAVLDMKAWFEAKGQKVEITPVTDVDRTKKTLDVTFEVVGSK